MKYSVILCYRNRLEHLRIVVPALRAVFGNTAELIVVEQNNTDKFLRGQLFNAGAQVATGDVLIFHDVDHYPASNVGELLSTLYDPGKDDLLLPIQRITYVRNDLSVKPLDEVPSGYRHFCNGVDADFFGGVSVFKRDAFFRINGFNSLYRGWGLEDADLRERVKHYQLTGHRGAGHFFALDHPDSNPGIGDPTFQANQQLFAHWQDYLAAGVTTQFQTMDEVASPVEGVDRWVQVTNIFTATKAAHPFMSVPALTAFYADTPEKHTVIWQSLKALVNDHEDLRRHRTWVVENRFGYGNRAFHWMWNLIVKDLPRDFKFLEIGVYMGQIVSLISMLNRAHKKGGSVYGITPLTNAGDQYSKHPDLNYEDAIRRIYYEFGLDGRDLQLIVGLSNQPSVVATAQGEAPFDVVYVDGCHDYDVVVSDLTHYGAMLKPGGLLVVDDASCSLNIPNGLIRMDWRGLPDVCRAVHDVIETDQHYQHLFAVGHNRVWRRV